MEVEHLASIQPTLQLGNQPLQQTLWGNAQVWHRCPQKLHTGVAIIYCQSLRNRSIRLECTTKEAVGRYADARPSNRILLLRQLLLQAHESRDTRGAKQQPQLLLTLLVRATVHWIYEGIPAGHQLTRQQPICKVCKPAWLQTLQRLPPGIMLLAAASTSRGCCPASMYPVITASAAGLQAHRTASERGPAANKVSAEKPLTTPRSATSANNNFTNEVTTRALVVSNPARVSRGCCNSSGCSSSSGSIARKTIKQQSG
eukprot:CAMPEP_0204249904 /NCGR_PEP_ID=MMETSP0361-20130328/99896_1 /ASSEMBLY_ACC=CAM_ASM_000343 /TAXON_ID=268821 /ORGANISM="Scrippsiella Hangoei, Strain SHTV-5" /LENGTH=257 /DNA_ID=CAMNT_0051223173 /DNA_START=194 /DNA_END=965 /DNA_ORIENTATION=-